MALFSLQNNDDINAIIIITIHLPLHLVPGSVQSPSHMVTFFKSRYDFASCVNAVSIFKKRFRKLSDLLSWGAELVQLKAEHSKSSPGLGLTSCIQELLCQCVMDKFIDE